MTGREVRALLSRGDRDADEIEPKLRATFDPKDDGTRYRARAVLAPTSTTKEKETDTP